jgi:hypothetical protein
MGLVGQAAHILGTVTKPEGKIRNGRPSHRWRHDVKMYKRVWTGFNWLTISFTVGLSRKYLLISRFRKITLFVSVRRLLWSRTHLKQLSVLRLINFILIYILLYLIKVIKLQFSYSYPFYSVLLHFPHYMNRKKIMSIR